MQYEGNFKEDWNSGASVNHSSTMHNGTSRTTNGNGSVYVRLSKVKNIIIVISTKKATDDVILNIRKGE